MICKFCASFLAAVLAAYTSFAADLARVYTVDGATAAEDIAEVIPFIPEGTLKYGYDFNDGKYQLESGSTGTHLACGDIAADILEDALILGSRAEKHHGTGFSYGNGDWSIATVALATSAGEVIYAVGGQKGSTGLIGLRNAGNNTIEAFTANAGKVTSVTLDEDPAASYHLYTIVYSNGKLKMNVDGGAFTEAVDFATGTAEQWQFGGIHSGADKLVGINNATSGSMDEFRVYTVALTQAQTYAVAKEFDVIGKTIEDYVFTETTTVSQMLFGARSVTVRAGDDGVVTFTAANTFTGGLVVESGTAKTTSATGFGPNNYNSWETPDALGQIEVKAGATLDLANTKNTCYAITTAGTITNSGADIDTGARQTVKIALSGDATVSGNTFGLLAPDHNATTLDLGEHTLTVAMNEGEQFLLSNTTVSNSGTIKLMSGSLWINPNKSLNGEIKLDLSKFPKAGGTVATGTAAQLTKIGLAEGQTGWSLVADGTTLNAVYSNPIVKIGETVYDTFEDALAHLTDGAVVTILNSDEVSVQDFTDHAVTLTENEDGTYTAAFDKADGIALRFSEIMPKPSDKPYEITTQSGYDKNGLESGWVELENTSYKWVDLKDYKFCRANRGKVYTHADYGNFPSVMIPPRGRFTFYTSERYSNSYPEAKDGNTSAFQHGTFDGKPIWYGDMLIWGDKVNPKKFPYVTLVYKPEGAADQILETVIIPSDTPEGYSIIVGHDEGDGEATKRWLCPTPTFNKANSDTTDLVKIGPNVGPAYGTKHSATEFGPTAPAKPGVPYAVSLNVNPIYHASGTRAADAIASVTLVYRRDLDDTTRGRVTMTKTGVDAGGDVWTAEIPADAIPAAGHLLQWKTEITDVANNTWTSPSFMNKDDGYEWFGTITEPGELDSAKLPTWHLFADALSLKWMDTDADDQSPTEIPNQARVAIYDSSTSNYYDYVRIDLRGNTSAHFAKKSHGLRFSKVNPLTIYDPVRKTTWKEIRKSSLIGEPADPSFMRQMIAFWLWDRMGNKVPFDFPVRCNLNGAFYQLAFHSERFTDELIEDVYGFDKYGYGYKNVGTLKSGSGTTAGGIEKKTPDDGNESDITVLQNELRAPLKSRGIDTLNASNNEELPAVTKFVVEKFNLPAWLNYLASARITQEMDDVWANISIYYENAEMKEKDVYRGPGTWMPLGYDFNLSFGQWYINDVGSGSGLMANQDWFKSHPFYGGNVVRCYKQAAMTTTCNEGNRAIEAVWQSPKFRRLYLRRLRTLMDQELKAPGTPETEVPFMTKMRELATLMEADAVLDQKKWPHSSSNTGAIDVWRDGVAWPETMAAGIDDIWNNYVLPRQTHLYVTHSVTNVTEKCQIGYGSALNAGIPLAQKPLEELKDGLSAEAVEGGIVIRNANDEAIDLSGWDVAGPVVMKLPAGTVIDQALDGVSGEVFVVTDRVAYIAANESTLTDEVVIGNAKAGSGTDIGLTAADGTIVLSADVILPPGTYHGRNYDVPVRLAPAGSFAFEGVAFNGGLTLGDGSFTLKNQNGYTNTASVVTAPTANISFTGKGAFELKGEKTSGTLMTVNNLIVSNGVFTVESKSTTSETAAVYLNGGFAVEDKGTVNLKLTKNAAQGRGFFIANKDMFCRLGKGGSFNAELNGPGCQAIHGEKGSVDLEILDGAKVNVTGSGQGVDCFKMAGHINLVGGDLNVILVKGNCFAGAKSDNFTGTAKAFVIGSADALHGNVVNAADISGKTIKEWTAPEITGVETVKLFMMINGQEVTLDAEGPATWEKVEVTESTTIAELVGATQAETLAKFKEVTPTVIATWAKSHSASTKPGEAIDLVAFALNCATSEVDKKKQAFKVTISFGEDGKPIVTTAEGVTLNIEPTIKGSAEVNGSYELKADNEAARFFKAIIEL